MIHRTRWAAAAAVLTFALATAACSSDETPGPSADGGCGTGERIVVNSPYPTQPVSLDPNYDTVVDFLQISRNFADGLFRLDDDMKVQPALATEFAQPDDVTYNITLRDDVLFHDGTPFTSADVVYTFDRIANDQELASKQKTYVSNVASVTATSESEVQIVLKQPDASFVNALANVIYITPQAPIEEIGVAQFGQAPIGTGPFKFETWNEGDSVVLTANCDYWGDKPIPSEVEFRFIPEPATAISSLQSGEVDIISQVAPDLAAGLEGSSEVTVKQSEGNQTLWLTPNTLEGPMADERVRQALNYAIDKDAITGQLLGGFATPVGQVNGASVFGYSDDIEPYPYEPDKARELLEEAGYGSGLHIELVTHRENLRSVMQSIQPYLEEVGIQVTTQFDPNFFADTFLGQKMGPNQVMVQTISNLLMDADYTLGLHFDGARRGLYFHTPETDAMISEARGEQDRDARKAAYDELNAAFYEIAPAVFLYSPQALYGVNSRVDFEPRPDGAIYLAGLTKTP